ncbi:MAG: CinA family protein [Rhodospirillales bacterium]
MFSANQKTLAEDVLNACRDQGLKLAAAESCTGGLITGLLTAVSGSSDVVERGFVTYTNESKHELLGVPESLIESVGAVSGEVALAMAEGALKHSSAQIAVAVTGVAGPTGGTADKPVGLVHIAVARDGAETLFEHHTFDGDRDAVRVQTVWAALKLVRCRIG